MAGVAGTTDSEHHQWVPRMDEARRRIAECRIKKDGALDLGGLSLDDEALETLAPEIENLGPLEALYLGLAADVREKSRYMLATEGYWRRNAVRVLPARLLSAHPSLEHLDLAYNQLGALPEVIGSLTALRHLDLHHNQLSELPEAFGHLTALQTLSLHSNQLTALPETFGRLTALRALYLHDNQLTALPEAFGCLTALQHLLLHGNQLTALPDTIGHLTALQTLLLHENRLAALPEAFGRLTALQGVSLASNQLTALPDSIGHLTALQTLFLHENRLTALPESVGRLTALETLVLHGNPITYPPPEFLTQSAKAIVEFLAGVEANGRPLYEAKVVLVGDPEHGKTALRGWLQYGRFIEPQRATRGGEIGWRDLVAGRDFVASKAERRTLRSLFASRKKGRANIWDFGGQDVYRPNQQPLFTPGALYLLICNGRKNLNESGVPEWLRLIQLRAGRDARVLMVATHMGEHDGSLSLAPLKDDLRSMIKGVFCVDSPSSYGIKPLLTRVWSEVTKLPGFGHRWPVGYIEARDKVLSLRTTNGKPRRPFMSFAEFRDTCQPYGIHDYAARSLATAMSMQGRLDYKGTGAEPDRLVILNPEWLLKAMAYVIDDPETKASGGVLNRRDLARIWRDHGRPAGDNPIRYEEHVWPHLLGLLAAHEILYRLGDDEWIVPQIVTDVPPDIPWKEPAARTVRRDCDLDYPIPGLMAVLTVRHHYKYVSRRLFWQRGAFLRHPHSGAEGLVTVDGQQSIRLETRGPGADALMADLMASVERLVHERWPGTAGDDVPPYRFSVPCPVAGCRGHFPLRDLEADLHHNRTEAACVGGTRHTHAIAKLLYGIEEPDAVAEIRRASLGSQTFGQPPRVLEISRVDDDTLRSRAKDTIKRRARIQIYCELSGKAVDGAVDVIEVDKGWWEAAKRWAPWILRGGMIVGGGMDFPIPTDSPGGRDRKDPDGGDEQVLGLPMGKFARPDGQILPVVVADKLIVIANKGCMRQTRISTGRWVWASPAEADRNDPTIPKERY